MANLKLTKQEAIKKHRELWNWIADKIIEWKKPVNTNEYFFKNNIAICDIPESYCYCCDYVSWTLDENKGCECCPIKWTDNDDKCVAFESPYDMFTDLCYEDEFTDEDIIKASNLAREIANLPEREEIE